jgi:hypothetical protein
VSERPSYWDYRLTRETVDGEHYYSIREVFFTADGVAILWDEEPTDVSQSVEGIRAILVRMLTAAEMPIIDLDTQPPAEVDS